MSNEKQSPGPWVALGGVEVYDVDGDLVATASNKANARLIAAAKEMQVLLKQAGERLRHCLDALNAPGPAKIEQDIAALLARIDGDVP